MDNTLANDIQYGKISSNCCEDLFYYSEDSSTNQRAWG
jgi:hypothetical protein